MRLIDADELKINMDNGMQGTAREYLKFYQMAVDDQPTAYDPDMVVQQLEAEKSYCERYRGPKRAFIEEGIRRAIRIVKKGGAV